MTISKIICACAALLLLALAPAARADEVVAATGAPLSIELNKGTLVRMSKPAASVFIANPEIADVAVKSPRLVYVFGKKSGETTLFAVDENDNVLLSRQV